MTIGSVSLPVASLTACAGSVEGDDLYGGVTLTVPLTFGRGSSALKSATHLLTEETKLKQVKIVHYQTLINQQNHKILRDNERHQHEIALMCNEMHRAGMLLDDPGMCGKYGYTDANHTPSLGTAGTRAIAHYH